MSYYSLDELSQNIISFQYTPLSTTTTPLYKDTSSISRNESTAITDMSEPIIRTRSVTFTEKNDTVLFFKDSSPNEIIPNHKIQVPCDTITTTDSCYQSTMQLPMYR